MAVSASQISNGTEKRTAIRTESGSSSWPAGDSLPWFRAVYAGGILLYFMFILVDHILFGERAATFFLLRLLLVLPAGIAALLLTRWNRFLRHAGVVNTALFAVTGVSILLMFLAGRESRTVHLIALGLVPVLLFGYLLLRLRFLQASITGISLTLLLAVLMLTAVNTPGNAFGLILLFLLSVNLIGGAAAWLLEKRDRETCRLKQQLEELSSHDNLTGLRNRLYFDEFISGEIARFITDRKRAGGRETRSGANPDDCYGLYLLDVDRFREINDRYGHAAGDAILRQFADLLTGSVRGADAVFRWGGEEFIVILRNAHSAFLPVFAAKIVKAIRSHTFTLPGGKPVPVTASAGFVGIPFGETDNAEQLIHHADAALEEAKSAGRDRAVQAVFRNDAVDFEPVLKIFEQTGGGDNGSVLF